MKKINITIILMIIAIIMLLIAPLATTPLYYKILAWFITGVSIYLTILFHNRDNKQILWGLIFGLIAILFNPIFTINLGSTGWTIANIIIAIVFGYNIKNFLKPNTK